MKTVQSLLILFVLLVLPVVLFAQDDPGGDPGTPIDGGISILIAAGVGYGAREYRRHRKKSRD